jgi:hypothetical protein
MDLQGILDRVSQGLRHELRAEGAPADADDEQVGEAAAGTLDFAVVHILRETLDAAQCGLDLAGQRRLGCKLGSAQPVMAHHSVLIGIGDRPAFKILHCRKRLPCRGFHALEEPVPEAHPEMSR